MKPTDRQRRNAVARILAGETTPEAEAQRLQVSARTIYRWVEEARAVSGHPENVTKDADTDVRQQTSENVTPPGKTPSDTQNPALKAALDAAGETSGQVNAPTAAPANPEQARADMEGFCLEAYGGLKAAVGAALVQWNYSPPLDPSSPEVLKLLRVGAVATTAIRANAPRLYPMLVKWTSGWGPLIVAIGMDSVGMMVALGGLAKSKGWQPAKKKERGEDAPAQKKEKAFDQAAARERQQELEDKMAQPGVANVDPGNNSQQLNAPRPDAA